MESSFNDIWAIFISSIDIMYIIMCNVATYAIIKMIETVSSKYLTKAWKRIISAIVAAILGIIVVKMGHDREAVFYGFFIQFIVYDYLWKWAIKKLEKFSSSENKDTEAEE